ncbi:zinc finger MYM-type protein 6 [Trichonephila clavipes]|nr:zinc finger MYM-type protein 6 [Trichonephila clavipes]
MRTKPRPTKRPKIIAECFTVRFHLDETTDITKISQLIIYVRCIFNEDITETFLCCKSLDGKTTGEKIFEVINEYFEAKSLTWANCVAVCTDGAAALTGLNKRLRGLIQIVAPHMVFNHCMIHRQALVAKDMDEELHNILQNASEGNPHVYVETPLHPEKLTVWCALWAGGIIGPYFFKNDEGHNVTVNGDRYRAMITNFFIPELNNHDVQELWF